MKIAFPSKFTCKGSVHDNKRKAAKSGVNEFSLKLTEFPPPFDQLNVMYIQDVTKGGALSLLPRNGFEKHTRQVAWNKIHHGLRSHTAFRGTTKLVMTLDDARGVYVWEWPKGKK